MGKIFNLDSPFTQFMNRVADLMILNVVMIICSLPIVTIGASITATYYVTLKMVRNEESYIVKSFFKSFKQNFVQATVIWLLTLLAGGVFVIDYMIVTGRIGNINITGSTMASVMQVLLIMVFIVYTFSFIYVFPILSKFDNTTKNTIKNAFLMSVRHFPTTLVCLIVTLVAAVLWWFLGFVKLISVMILFSLVCYINSLLFVKVFDNYIPKSEEEDITESVEGLTE